MTGRAAKDTRENISVEEKMNRGCGTSEVTEAHLL